MLLSSSACHYRCCTVNFPQGWPKFISNAFVKTPDDSSLIHVYLGPFSTQTTLADGKCLCLGRNRQRLIVFSDNEVTVSVETLYPFSDTLNTTITADKAFTYQVRIPSWVTDGTITVNGGKAEVVSPVNGLHSVEVGAGTTKFTLNLPADITIGKKSNLRDANPCTYAWMHSPESRPHNSVAVHRGPLHYAFDISRGEKVLAQDAHEPMAVDLQFDAAETWQYAIDPSSLKFHNSPPSSGSLPSPIFDSGLPPVSITATACEVDWPIAGTTFASPPPSNPKCKGAATTITLRPFGVSALCFCVGLCG